jgi:hypothetical protein
MFASPGTRSGRGKLLAKHGQREVPAAQTLKIASTFAILNLSIATVGGQAVANPPGHIGVGGELEFVFIAATDTWMCMSAFYGRPSRTPKFADFAWFNQGGMWATDNISALMYGNAASATYQNNCLQQVTPNSGNNFTVRATFNFDAMEYGTNEPICGIFLRNSTSGRMLTAWSGISNTNTRNQGWQRLNSATSFNANLLTIQVMEPAHALRIDVISGTANFYNGQDGWNWRDGPITTDAIASFINASGGSIDQCGIFSNPQNNWQTGQITSFLAIPTT